ncbi:MAG: hypothetical protein ABSF58_14840 [Solirubrobacteraceae bacterium]|jgi:hypothetical protein
MNVPVVGGVVGPGLTGSAIACPTGPGEREVLFEPQAGPRERSDPEAGPDPCQTSCGGARA